MIERFGKRIGVSLACAMWLALSAPQIATAQEEEPVPAVYAVYFQCEPAKTARASEIILDSWGPIVQARIDAGQLLAWGSLSHHTGGSWSTTCGRGHSAPIRPTSSRRRDRALACPPTGCAMRAGKVWRI